MIRSLLFAPATRPDVLAKLPRSEPDVAIIDLEDAVPPQAKAEARVNARAAIVDLAGLDNGPVVYVRVNATATEWFADDLRDGLADGVGAVVVPKLESADDVARVTAALTGAGREGLPIVAGIETAWGVARCEEVLAAPGVTAAYFGAEDFVADVGGMRTGSNDEVHYARSRVALAARLARVAAVDMVVTDFRDDERFDREAAEARALGYVGKLCIHPNQVALARAAFTPSDDEVDRAHRLLAAYDAAVVEGRAAVAFEGQMVDEPLARQARTVIAAAQQEG